MADDMDVWLDYHDIDDEGRVLTLRKFFVSDDLAVAGQRVLTGDYEGNRYDGTVVGVEASGVVTIELDHGTTMPTQRPAPADR
ncbi:MAG TPA: hypothetical protein VNA57_00665 [Acidimicrobiales bacterium]|nr:hypothetical protein [Acidimicrobiales bacterium]